LLNGLSATAFQAAGSYAVTTGPNAFASAQTISTGDLSISRGDLDLPATTGPGAGVIMLGGAPFVHEFGTFNTFIGQGAGNFTMTGGGNTASGTQALASNTTGSGNAASGYQALNANTTGNSNTASGYLALLATNGSNNTASGYEALAENQTGNQNTANGARALWMNTTGSNNVAIGYFSGVSPNGASGNITGVNNTFLGTYSGPGTATNLSNATAIGANALVSQSNALVLGGTGANAVSVGIGTPTPSHVFTIAQGAGQAIADGWTTYSSRRWKTNIQTLQGALAKVEQLRGVSYELKANGKHEVGVIAEEVGTVIPEVVTWEKNGKDAQSVDYGRLTALLIEAMKEQQALISEQQEQISAQQGQMRVQQIQIARLTRQVKTIQTTLKTGGRSGSAIRTVKAEETSVRQY
jgi:hypothetical protein